MATTMKRTTTGLLQGTQTVVSAEDLDEMVRYLTHRVGDPELLRALRIERARSMIQSANASSSGAARRPRVTRTGR